ncbi:SusD family protein [uncultured Paludibacter sp.]|nr:SusD family protein [uncultured Paludibacter sp.]
MKTKIKFIILSCVLALSSCSLQEEPYGFYSEQNFFNTAADAESALCYAYNALTFLEYSRCVFNLGEIPTENIIPKRDSEDLNNLDYWDVSTFKTNSILYQFFSYAFISINRANAVIKYVPKGNYDQALKNQYMGEAYFLRAWNYFNLVRVFGLVPVHTETVETLNQTSAPLFENMDAVYDLIISDCKKAEELMAIYSTPKTGRTDKVAAQSLAAKAYLFMASAKEHNVPLYRDMRRDFNQMYDSASYYAGKVINDQTTYKFDNSLLDIYDVEKNHGPEHIFLMSMDRTGSTEGEYSKISKMFIPYIGGATVYLDNGNGTFIPTHDGWSVYQTTTPFYESFNSNDKRKTQLIVTKVYDKDGNVTASYPGKITYPFSRKYIDPKFIGDKTSTRPFLIRFSDVALIYAEAAGPTAKSYELVNFIRNRAGLSNLTTGLSKDDFRKEVYKERTWEMAYEGDHLYDLRRWNRVTTDVPDAKDLTEEEAAFYPIPQVEIDLNGSLIK